MSRTPPTDLAPDPATSTNTAAPSDPTPPLERLLQVIAARAGPDGWWEFSYSVLGAGFPVSDPRRLEAGLAELERRGLIEVDRCRVRLAAGRA